MVKRAGPLGRGRLVQLQLRIGPFFIGFPVGIDIFTKLAPGGNLLLGDYGLLGGQQSRLGLAIHCLRQTAVGAMCESHGILCRKIEGQIKPKS